MDPATCNRTHHTPSPANAAKAFTCTGRHMVPHLRSAGAGLVIKTFSLFLALSMGTVSCAPSALPLPPNHPAAQTAQATKPTDASALLAPGVAGDVLADPVPIRAPVRPPSVSPSPSPAPPAPAKPTKAPTKPTKPTKPTTKPTKPTTKPAPPAPPAPPTAPVDHSHHHGGMP